MSILQLIRENNPEAIIWDNLDESIIGYSSDFVAVYDIDKMIDCLVKQNSEWTDEDALEWIDFNILTAYVGEYTPLHIYTK